MINSVNKRIFCRNSSKVSTFWENYAFALNFQINCIEFLIELNQIFGKIGKLSSLACLLVDSLLISPLVIVRPNTLKKIFLIYDFSDESVLISLIFLKDLF